MSYMSKKDLVKEIVSCGKDPKYFIKNYCKITHPDKGLISFKTWDFQEQLLDDYVNNRKIIINKSRQLGISTLTAAYCAWLMLFHREKNIMIIATKFEVAGNLVKKVKNIFKNLPSFFNQLATITTDNRTSFILSNGSQIKASPTNIDAGRSEALSLLVVDEAAHVENFNEIWTALAPTMALGGRCIALSSPNGVGNWFHKTFINAEKNLNEFYAVTLPWDVHPERDQEWFEREKKGWSSREFAQEYLCFDEDTRIYTQNGLKKLKDVYVGELVLTHKGNWKPIKEKRSRLADVVKVQSHLNKTETFITPDHPVLLENEEWKCFDEAQNDFICSIPKNVSFSNENKLFDLTTIKPGFFSIKENDEGMCFINDRKHKTLHKKIIKIDYDFGYFIGLFLAEGNYNKNQAINFAFNYSTELFTWVSKLQQIIKKKFGLENTSVYHNENTGTLQINSALLKKMVQLFVDGKRAPQKHLSAFAYENASKDFLRGVVDGVFRGDGCLLEPYNKKLNITSQELIYDCKFILSILGYGYASIVSPKENNKKIMGRDVSCKTSYSINCLATRNKKIEEISDLCECEFHREHSNWKNKVNENEGFFLDKVFSKQDHFEKKRVVNISVEEDESYVTEHFVVHNCSFNASGETVIEPEDIERIFESVEEPKWKAGFDRNMWIWEKVDIDKKYIAICDVARGDGEDYSTIQMLDIENFKQVLEYRGKVTPDIFSSLIKDVGEEYNNALVVIEYNTLGYTVSTKLIDLEYPNIAYFKKGTYDFVDIHNIHNRTDILPGFTMSVKTRPLVVAKLEEFIRNKKIKIVSRRTYDELATFIWNNGKPQAMKGHHDDLLMPLAIGSWVFDQAFQTKEKENSFKKAALNATKIQRKSLNSAQTNYKKKNYLTPSQRDAARYQKRFAWVYRG